MIVTVTMMWMVKVPINDVVDMITVGNRFVSTTWTVDVACLVSAACMFWCAYIGVDSVDI